MVGFSRGVSVEQIMQNYSANIKDFDKFLDGWSLQLNQGTPTLAFVNTNTDQSLLVSLFLNKISHLEPYLQVQFGDVARSVVWGVGIHESEHSGHPARAIFNKLMTEIGFRLGVLEPEVPYSEDNYPEPEEYS